MELISCVFDIVGTIALAISGALLALRKSMDMFGVVVLALTTAVGGGIVRDVLLGLTPPMAFVNPWYSLLAACVGFLVFILAYFHIGFRTHSKMAEKVLLWVDALGLGVFTMTGIAIAETLSCCNWFLCLFVGVVTGVGGGILRDMFAGDIPFVFVKSFYASAALFGGIVCVVGWGYLESWQCMLLGAFVTFMLRTLAIYYDWHLPKVDRKDDK
ncbi:MAG: trimeric intracellular cation channel family protein [Phascolarctobacterium sp.]|nr:trimeric intracellular cation channel family protein [Candidatus Phascolarctobacterium equi]